MNFKNEKRELNPWEWAECDSNGNIIRIFDGRLTMPIYDHDTEKEIKKITKHWAKICKKYPLSFRKNLKNIIKSDIIYKIKEKKEKKK